MNVREYARRQQRPLGPLRKLVRAVLHSLGVPITPVQTQEVAVRLYRPVLAARHANYDTALAYLRSEKLPSGIVVPRPRDYPIEALTSTIERVTMKLRIVGEPVTEATRTDTRVIETARRAIEGPIGRQALEPARETIADIGENEEHVHYGWARVLVGAYSCSFCAMLASRGAVYSSEAAAKGRGGSPLDLYHTPYPNKNGLTVGGFCDCVAVQVHDGRSWEGEKAAAALDALWKKHQGDLNSEGRRDPLNAFRREWDGRIRARESMSAFLPESVKAAA